MPPQNYVKSTEKVIEMNRKKLLKQNYPFARKLKSISGGLVEGNNQLCHSLFATGNIEQPFRQTLMET